MIELAAHRHFVGGLSPVSPALRAFLRRRVRIDVEPRGEHVLAMTEKQNWVLTFTRPDEAGREIGRYASRDDAMFAAQDHYDRATRLEDPDEQDELGWQMSFASATALSSIGAYRIRLSDPSGR